MADDNEEFWAEERARAAAERGRLADPSACGTCRTRVEAGQQVEHDECAQRATLLQAPDHPAYELTTGLTEQELAALPARFHVPVYMDTCTPKAWVCAVCWGDGWCTGWPCATALKHGAQVFTPEHDAEQREAQQAAEVIGLRKQLDAYEVMNPQQCQAGKHADWLVDSERTHACPWCEIERLRAELEKYVGKEPTVAEEMQHLNHCLDAVYDACEAARRDGCVLTVEEIEQAADGNRPTHRPSRSEVLAEAKREVVAWLAKKAGEYWSTGSQQHRLQADTIATLASKVDGGAIRLFLNAAEKGAPVETESAASPAEIHAFLARHLAEDVHLRYQQAIGSHAVEQAAKHLRLAAACQQASGEITSPREYRAAADDIDPMKRGSGGPFPAELIRFGTKGGAVDA